MNDLCSIFCPFKSFFSHLTFSHRQPMVARWWLKSADEHQYRDNRRNHTSTTIGLVQVVLIFLCLIPGSVSVYASVPNQGDIDAMISRVVHTTKSGELCTFTHAEFFTYKSLQDAEDSCQYLMNIYANNDYVSCFDYDSEVEITLPCTRYNNTPYVGAARYRFEFTAKNRNGSDGYGWYTFDAPIAIDCGQELYTFSDKDSAYEAALNAFQSGFSNECSLSGFYHKVVPQEGYGYFRMFAHHAYRTGFVTIKYVYPYCKPSGTEAVFEFKEVDHDQCFKGCQVTNLSPTVTGKWVEELQGEYTGYACEDRLFVDLCRTTVQSG